MARNFEDDRDTYLDRLRVAAEARAELERAAAACGPGKRAYGRWRVIDRMGREPDRVISCCREEGRPGWHPDGDAACPDEKLPDGGFRYTLCFTSLQEYEPLDPATLEARQAACRGGVQGSLFEGLGRNEP
jgi:hypothetical protein